MKALSIYIHLAIALLGLLCVTMSCKKDKRENQEDTRQTYLNKTVSGSTTLTYVYDEQGRCTAEIIENTGAYPGVYKYNFSEFNSQGLPTRGTTVWPSNQNEDGKYFICTYNDNGERTEVKLYSKEGVLQLRVVNEISGNEVIQSRYNAANNLTAKEIRLYDTKGNNTKTQGYNAEGTLTGENRDVTYDDKKSLKGLPHVSWGNITGSILSVNNATAYSWESYALELEGTTLITYEYNEDGYPTKRTTVSEGNTTVINYEYIKR